MVCHVDKKEHRLALLQAVKQNLGTIDVLVLNAAASSFTGLTLETPEKHYDKLMRTNLRSTFLFAQDSMPLLTGSITGYSPAAPIGIYGVTKTAMQGLMKAMAT